MCERHNNSQPGRKKDLTSNALQGMFETPGFILQSPNAVKAT